MATRCIIAMRMNDSDMQTCRKFDKAGKSYPDNGLGWDNHTEAKCEEVTICGKYMQAYNHFDGYPTGVGQFLLGNCNAYDEILNVLLGGDMSVIGTLDDIHTALYYHSRVCESWAYIKPSFADKISELRNEEYTYLFYDGKWLVSDSDTDTYYLLEDVLALDDPDNFADEAKSLKAVKIED